MKDAQIEGFVEREGTVGVVFVGPVQNNLILFEEKFEDGDEVTLKKNSESILVNSIKIQTDGAFTGVINGFEPSFGTEFCGLHLDDQIKFQEKHIFGCVKKGY